MGNEHIKDDITCHQGNSNEPTVKYCYIPLRMAKAKTPAPQSTVEDVEQQETLIHRWRECKLVELLWSTLWGFLTKVNTLLP